VEFSSGDGLIAVAVEEQESLRQTVELLFDFDCDQGHNLGQMLLIIIFLQLSQDFFSVLSSASLIGIEHKIDVFTLVFVPLDLHWAELINIQQLDDLVAINLAVNANVLHDFLLDFIIVDMHEAGALLFPFIISNFMVR
jgi:hypothetical protein